MSNKRDPDDLPSRHFHKTLARKKVCEVTDEGSTDASSGYSRHVVACKLHKKLQTRIFNSGTHVKSMHVAPNIFRIVSPSSEPFYFRKLSVSKIMILATFRSNFRGISKV